MTRCLFAVGVILFGSVVNAQPIDLGNFGIGGSASERTPDPEISLSAELTAETLEPGAEATLAVTVKLPKGFYIYSTRPSSALATSIKVSEDAGLQPLDEKFRPDRLPKRVFEPQFNTEVEKFYDQVTWSRDYRITGTLDPADIQVVGDLTGAFCSTGEKGMCIPIRPPREFTVALMSAEQASRDEDETGESTEGGDDFSFSADDFAGSDFSATDFESSDFTDSNADGAGDATEPNSSDDATAEAESNGVVLVNEFEIEAAEGSLAKFLPLAFLGGFILNFMPCVLPVMAIKVMSFVQQAGEDRGRIFALNAVYALGVILVFCLLAALIVLPEYFSGLFGLLGLSGNNFGWGGLFQSQRFNMAMACLVFAMGMSLLGVFEIPIPGFVGSAAGSAQKEGLFGAFLTGIFATLLATPCTGPFVGVTIAWSIQQPPIHTFLVWATMGLGMASPYLVFGIVPGAVKLLPKPGNWMLRLKEFAGFVLMGTVIFVISFIDATYTVPLLIMLLGIAFALWMIGTVQSSTSFEGRLVGYTTAIVVGSFIVGFGYWTSPGESRTTNLVTTGGLQPIGNDDEQRPPVKAAVETSELPWETFSTNRLNDLRSTGRTVLIDFTADWCANCKVNENLALNTEKTYEFVQEHDVITLLADATHEDAEISMWLDRFRTSGLPLTVIFPGDRPNEPILLHSVYSQSALLSKLEEAVSTDIAALPTEQK
ncbi:protein-disulfide reductase DsbD family protein [Stratiformator vulcanicus]|uniref:Thiol:disulfide interchange protein DsbD n=1 Tax=Stratiformator vulcanicus TaxID=2527980 RepID=A0A517R208_9PLAN|nr:thioredoxin family protein [Stratiformator vulcanicus]QDT37891.1 Thiol:disulfide interchange protein DsbD precursor [Stratiformator vulcanicus]